MDEVASPLAARRDANARASAPRIHHRHYFVALANGRLGETSVAAAIGRNSPGRGRSTVTGTS
jgi:hypothetical protein